MYYYYSFLFNDSIDFACVSLDSELMVSLFGQVYALQLKI